MRSFGVVMFDGSPWLFTQKGKCRHFGELFNTGCWILTTSNAGNDDNFIKITIFSFQSIPRAYCRPVLSFATYIYIYIYIFPSLTGYRSNPEDVARTLRNRCVSICRWWLGTNCIVLMSIMITSNLGQCYCCTSVSVIWYYWWTRSITSIVIISFTFLNSQMKKSLSKVLLTCQHILVPYRHREVDRKWSPMTLLFSSACNCMYWSPNWCVVARPWDQGRLDTS